MRDQKAAAAWTCSLIHGHTWMLNHSGNNRVTREEEGVIKAILRTRHSNAQIFIWLADVFIIFSYIQPKIAIYLISINISQFMAYGRVLPKMEMIFQGLHYLVLSVELQINNRWIVTIKTAEWAQKWRTTITCKFSINLQQETFIHLHFLCLMCPSCKFVHILNALCGD